MLGLKGIEKSSSILIFLPFKHRKDKVDPSPRFGTEMNLTESASDLGLTKLLLLMTSASELIILTSSKHNKRLDGSA